MGEGTAEVEAPAFMPGRTSTQHHREEWDMLRGQSSHAGVHEEAAFDLEETPERQPGLAAHVWHCLHLGPEFLEEVRVDGR